MRHEFWRHVARSLSRPGVLALVVDSTAHSPGTRGARLFVGADGERRGTIGGGVMEKRVVDRALKVLASGGSWCELIELHHRREVDSGERSGMICAGSQTNLYRTLEPRDAEILAAWLDAGRGRLVIDSEGGVSFDAEASSTAPARLERDGASWRYSEPAIERRRLAVLGGGHCGQALGRLMRDVGWSVEVFETRPAVIADAALDGLRLVDDFRDAGPRIELPEITPVVVMTTDVPNDVRALLGVLSHEPSFPFIGLMGSAAKLDEIRRRLRGHGVDDEHLDRLVAPVGLAIGSDTPEEIAVSVAAQLIAQSRGFER